MAMKSEWLIDGRGLAVRVIAAVILAACAAPPPAPLPERPAAPSSDLAFDAGVDYAVDDLLTQMRRLPTFNPPAKTGILGDQKKEEPPRGVIAVDPAIDGITGQQTVASRSLDSRLLQRAAEKFTQFDVVPVSSASVGKAQ
jgi:hypothetical protein